MVAVAPPRLLAFVVPQRAAPEMVETTKRLRIAHVDAELERVARLSSRTVLLDRQIALALKEAGRIDGVEQRSSWLQRIANTRVSKSGPSHFGPVR